MAVTLLSISHADVLLGSRMINLPIVAIDVPTTLFLVLAPIVVAALYVNLHLYLGKLLHAFYHAPVDVPKKWRLADRIAPVADQRLRAHPEGRLRARAAAPASCAAW